MGIESTGGEINYIDYENFNAASCKVMIKGKVLILVVQKEK